MDTKGARKVMAKALNRKSKHLLL
ncbi:uncharacterized protein G2W53_001226 [Senna tora]|uniref:Uncharacterized protein n=1 Tax=Senna tora TaxID=362788 RepID=A0A835CK52_9FABA|nr:uncharacterized protein G2W53_001226 [Senna tora]